MFIKCGTVLWHLHDSCALLCDMLWLTNEKKYIAMKQKEWLHWSLGSLTCGIFGGIYGRIILVIGISTHSNPWLHLIHTPHWTLSTLQSICLSWVCLFNRITNLRHGISNLWEVYRFIFMSQYPGFCYHIPVWVWAIKILLVARIIFLLPEHLDTKVILPTSIMTRKDWLSS